MVYNVNNEEFNDEDSDWSFLDLYDEAIANGLSEEEANKAVDDYIASQVAIHGERWLSTYRDS